MLTDEHEHAMKVWRDACGESQEAFYRIGEQPNDPESIKQGQLADQAAAAVIAADRAACGAGLILGGMNRVGVRLIILPLIFLGIREVVQGDPHIRHRSSA